MKVWKIERWLMGTFPEYGADWEPFQVTDCWVFFRRLVEQSE